MLRSLLLLILVFHAIIHLLGFVKYWGLAPVSQLTGRTIFEIPEHLHRPYAVAWLAATLLLLTGGVGMMLRQEWWPLIAGLGVLSSQMLLIIAWPDAKFGTIANIIILLAALPAAAEVRFNRSARDDMDAVLRATQQLPATVITKEMIAGLPDPVQRWLSSSGVIGRTPASTIRLTQRGEMRQRPDGDWVPATAEQVFSVNPPGFVWRTTMEMMPLVTVLGKDRYSAGHGRMQISAYGLFTIVDGSGEQMDQGTMLRYLAEICWFPTAALSPNLSWTPVDSLTAQATLTDGDRSVSGIFRFNEAGDAVGFEADRYMDRPDGATLERWMITMEEVKDLSGFRIPVRSSVTWKLKEGDHTWFRLEVESIEYQ
jgi:hypothetical protein